MVWLRRPPCEPVHALRKEARARNSLDENEARLMGAIEDGSIDVRDLPMFSRASEIVE